MCEDYAQQRCMKTHAVDYVVCIELAELPFSLFALPFQFLNSFLQDIT